MTCGLAEEETRLVTSRGRNNSTRQRLVMCHSFCVLTCIYERRISVALYRVSTGSLSPGSGTARRPPAGGPVRGNQPRSMSGMTTLITHN